jgi:hypothetical protein
MKLNLTPSAIEAIYEIQENPILVGVIEDVENFILENINSDDNSEEKSDIPRKTLDNIKGLRSIRKLLGKICEEEGES